MWMRDLVVNGEKLPKLNELNGYLAYRGVNQYGNTLLKN